MSKFKPGDRVRVIKRSTNCKPTATCCLQFIDTIGIVVESHWSSPNGIAVKNFKHTTEWCSAFSEDCLELVKEDWDK